MLLWFSFILNGFFIAMHFVTMLSSVARILLLLNLIFIAKESQHLQSGNAPKHEQMKHRKIFATYCLTLWILSAYELNAIINTEYANNTVIKSVFQIIWISLFFIGAYTIHHNLSLSTFHKIKSY